MKQKKIVVKMIWQILIVQLLSLLNIRLERRNILLILINNQQT
jgi:hypothetical protein